MKNKYLYITAIITSGIFFFSCSVITTNPPFNIINSSEKVKNFNENEVFLVPDGKQTYEWVIRLTDKNGQSLSKAKVNFSVVPVRPLIDLRNVNDIAPKYGSNEEKFRKKVSSGEIRLLGTVNPSSGETDNNGFIKTVYTVSNVAGNESEIGQEKIIANSGENLIFETTINIGYKNFVSIPTVPGGLIISGATGRYAGQPVSVILKNIGEKISSEKWNFPLTVTAGTLRWGGLYPPHFTHRTGNSLDFRPMSTDGNPTWCQTDGKYAPNYDRIKTLELIKIFKESGVSEIIFNDPEALSLGVKPLAGHHNHLHVSWNATESEYLETIK